MDAPAWYGFVVRVSREHEWRYGEYRTEELVLLESCRKALIAVKAGLAEGDREGLQHTVYLAPGTSEKLWRT
jgi:hypothetical protein